MKKQSQIFARTVFAFWLYGIYKCTYNIYMYMYMYMYMPSIGRNAFCPLGDIHIGLCDTCIC